MRRSPELPARLRMREQQHRRREKSRETCRRQARERLAGSNAAVLRGARGRIGEIADRRRQSDRRSDTASKLHGLSANAMPSNNLRNPA